MVGYGQAGSCLCIAVGDPNVAGSREARPSAASLPASRVARPGADSLLPHDVRAASINSVPSQTPDRNAHFQASYQHLGASCLEFTCLVAHHPIVAPEVLHAVGIGVDHAAVQRFLVGAVFFAISKEVGYVRNCSVCDRRRGATTGSVAANNTCTCSRVRKVNTTRSGGAAVYAGARRQLWAPLTLGKRGLSVRKGRRVGRQTHRFAMGTRLSPAGQCQKCGHTECD